MRRFLLILVSFVSFAAFAQTASAPADSVSVASQPVTNSLQSFKFGYLSYDAAFKAMPEYAIALKNIADLKAKYDAETKRVEEDFNKKYEDFLDGQREFPETILRKRQNELQEMLNKNIAFKEESRRLLANAEKEIFAPLHEKLAALLKIIGEDRGYSFIINTDNNACPFINGAQGEDINGIVKATLETK